MSNSIYPCKAWPSTKNDKEVATVKIVYSMIVGWLIVLVVVGVGFYRALEGQFAAKAKNHVIENISGEIAK